MSPIVTIVVFCALAALCYLLAHRALPWLVVRLGRLLGFRMEMTPLTAKRVRRFKSIKRGYWSFVLVTTAFVMSLFLELYVNDKPLYIRWGDTTQYPAVASWLNAWAPFVDLKDQAREKDYGLQGEGQVDYRTYGRWVADPEALEADAAALEAGIVEDEARFRAMLAQNATDRGLVYDLKTPLPDFKLAEYAAKRDEAAFLRGLKPDFEAGKASIVLCAVPYSPTEQLLHLPGAPPHTPLQKDMPILGTDFEGKDVLSQLLYGFRVSFAFAIMVAFIGYTIGVSAGAIMGYFGGWIDIVVQRVIEVWSSIPFLFTMMIIASIYTPSFMVLVIMLVALRAWIGITYTMRGEYYREKARDYVQAAGAIGVGNAKIMARHILPNALVPVVTYLPFSIVAYIGILVSLDFLGFGLPPEVPSWGRLLRQGADNIVNYPELVLFPVVALAITLFCVVVVGEAVREAFDPKKYARLR